MQLAEKLNITNRAVSKWETGKSIPDISVMPELCEIFDITVNELLSGERIDKEDYVMKAENNFLQMFNNNKGKQRLAIMQLLEMDCLYVDWYWYFHFRIYWSYQEYKM